MKTNTRWLWLLAMAIVIALPPSASAIELVRKATTEVAASHMDTASPWITHPAAYGAGFRQEPIALQFRRSFDLARKPARLQVRVSADQRFILYVNGSRVAAGPARGDRQHYRYEIIDLAPYLATGRNIVAAHVWSDGKLAPLATVSTGHTGFVLKAEEDADRIVDTTAGWEVRVDTSRTVSSGRRQLNGQVGPTYYVAGPPEHHDAARQLTGWNSGAEGGDWKPAVAVVSATEERRTLVPDPLPQMRYDAPTVGKVVRVIGASSKPSGPVRVRPGERAAVLYDFGRVMAGYPVLVTSGGKGGEVTLTYSEALYHPATKGPGGVAVRFTDRARVADGLALGLTDSFATDGRKDARFEPLWWRAGRFVEVRVTAGEAPLTLDRVEMRETGYPFEQRGSFVSDDEQLNRIWRVGWNTALFDAHETYMDTAYWEQLQYIGDTRIQALLSYDVAGDPRLAEQALDAFGASRIIDGLPQSAWPMSATNPIPPFAFLWIGMLHDYWMRQPDTGVLRRNLSGMRGVLDWYKPFVRSDGMVRATPGWLFIDWRDGLGSERDMSGTAPDSCIIALLRIGALRDAADIERAVGDEARVAANLADAALAAKGVHAQCWDPKRGLYADDPDHSRFSQHANALAVLYDVAPEASRKQIMERITVPGAGIDAPPGITGTTYYFSFYLAQALDHAGLADRYSSFLMTWRNLLEQHFTTWPEEPDPSRSDSHAWSAHPTSGLLAYVAGIQPAAPGFAKVRVAPNLGALKKLDASMAHPHGVIRVRYSTAGGSTTAKIDLPNGTSGTFVLGGQEWQLHPGTNSITAPNG